MAQPVKVSELLIKWVQSILRFRPLQRTHEDSTEPWLPGCSTQEVISRRLKMEDFYPPSSTHFLKEKLF